MDLIQNTPHLWLIAGVILIILEFVLMPGVGFLFAGLAALVVGAITELNISHSQAVEWIVFFVATIIFAAFLWAPFSRFRLNKSNKVFSDMVGHKAILVNSIAPGETGQVKWSGTIMNAKLTADAVYSLAAGADVTIKEVVGNTVIVASE